MLFAEFYRHPDSAGRAQHALELVGLESKAETRARADSPAGQQQRLAIALALVHDPELVFLDEPTTGLDPQARHNLWDVIRKINEEDGKTVILTTHYLEEAEELCDRVAIMDAAHIVALDTPGRADRVAGRRRPRRLGRRAGRARALHAGRAGDGARGAGSRPRQPAPARRTCPSAAPASRTSSCS